MHRIKLGGKKVQLSTVFEIKYMICYFVSFQTIRLSILNTTNWEREHANSGKNREICLKSNTKVKFFNSIKYGGRRGIKCEYFWISNANAEALKEGLESSGWRIWDKITETDTIFDQIQSYVKWLVVLNYVVDWNQVNLVQIQSHFSHFVPNKSN